MTYGCETWALNNTMMDRLAVARRKMECIMLGITLRDRKWNTWIRQETGVSDIINAIRKAKHRWASHIAWICDNRWTIRATEWPPRDSTRKQGRPKTKWRDDLTRQFGPVWWRLAKLCRHLWDQSRDGVPPSRVNTNPDDDDGDDLLFPKPSVILLVPENKGQSVGSEEKARLFSRPKWPSLGLWRW